MSALKTLHEVNSKECKAAHTLFFYIIVTSETQQVRASMDAVKPVHQTHTIYLFCCMSQLRQLWVIKILQVSLFFQMHTRMKTLKLSETKFLKSWTVLPFSASCVKLIGTRHNIQFHFPRPLSVKLTVHRNLLKLASHVELQPFVFVGFSGERRVGRGERRAA